MIYKNFRIICSFRVLLLTVTIYLFVHLLFETTSYALLFLVGIIILYQIYSLIRYVEKTNRSLNRFLQAIKYEDFSQLFREKGLGPSFDELTAAFTDVTNNFRRARSEKEEHYRYLQTVVQHVGIGVISFQQNGEIELINKTAKQLLKVSRLKNIKSLESFSKPFVDTLLRLKAGERTLIKVEAKTGLLQLAIYATEFRMREQKFTLVSLQNIKNELERERMTKELEIAHQVQMRLLPKTSPQIPGYDIAGICIPAKEVGGDYFDFIKIGNNKLGITIGDVSGKGVPAAIYMTLTKGVIQSQAEKNISPKEVLVKVNNFLYQSIELDSFVSMFYTVLYLNERKLICSRAGHNPAIHFCSKTNKYSPIEPAGMALGLDSGKIFSAIISEQEIKLNKGDLLIFYTDGFTEAMNKKLDLYGEDRLLNIIQKNKDKNAKELIKAVCQDVRDFTKEQPQYDDMTMVSLKVI